MQTTDALPYDVLPIGMIQPFGNVARAEALAAAADAYSAKMGDGVRHEVFVRQDGKFLVAAIDDDGEACWYIHESDAYKVAA